VSGVELVCAVCLYVRPRPDLTDDEVADTQTLTVKSGILVCVRHIDCVGDADMILHHAKTSATRMESEGRFTSAGDYQRWRIDQAR
jgi:hypothetical protein